MFRRRSWADDIGTSCLSEGMRHEYLISTDRRRLWRQNTRSMTYYSCGFEIYVLPAETRNSFLNEASSGITTFKECQSIPQRSPSFELQRKKIDIHILLICTELYFTICLSPLKLTTPASMQLIDFHLFNYTHNHMTNYMYNWVRCELLAMVDCVVSYVVFDDSYITLSQLSHKFSPA